MNCDVIEKCVAYLRKSDCQQGFYLWDPRMKLCYRISNHGAFSLLRMDVEGIFIKKGISVYYLDRY